jgi:hypothetical protein
MLRSPPPSSGGDLNGLLPIEVRRYAFVCEDRIDLRTNLIRQPPVGRRHVLLQLVLVPHPHEGNRNRRIPQHSRDRQLR